MERRSKGLALSNCNNYDNISTVTHQIILKTYHVLPNYRAVVSVNYHLGEVGVLLHFPCQRTYHSRPPVLDRHFEASSPTEWALGRHLVFLTVTRSRLD